MKVPRQDWSDPMSGPRDTEPPAIAALMIAVALIAAAVTVLVLVGAK